MSEATEQADLTVETDNANPVLRIVYHSDEITADSCMRLRQGIEALASVSKEPVRVVMATVGGDCDSAIGLIDYLQRCPCHVTIEISGFCWSAGAWILQAAHHRVMSASSSLMLHNGEAAVGGSRTSMRNWLKQQDHIDNIMMSLLCRRTKKDKRYWTKAMRDGDVLLTAKEAKALNLIDEVI